MSKELVVSSNSHETRVAILEDDQLVEIYFQRQHEYSLAGSIHKGRVTRVLPGMQSAFVDIGLDRDAFLYVSDFFEDNDEYDKIVTSVEEKILKLDKPGAGAAPVAAIPAIAPEIVALPAEIATVSAPAEAAVATVSAPSVLQPAGQSGAPERRRDDGRRDDGGRGRRGRRRGRGGPKERGGRGGLPESKFYSPGSRGPEPRGEAAPEPEAAAPMAQAAPAASAVQPVEGDDFFVLPGESLAKYRGGVESQGDDYADEGSDAADVVESALETEPEMVSELASEPAEPQAELAAAIEEIEEVVVATMQEPAVESAAPILQPA